MKLVTTAGRYLLGVQFTVFGLNGFLRFIHLPPPSTAYGVAFLTAAFGSHYMALIFALQFASGIALLAGRYVPLALLVLAAILVNIADFHLTMDPVPSGLVPGTVAVVLWVIAAIPYRRHFAALFAPVAEPA